MDYAKSFADRFALLYDRINTRELDGRDLLEVQYTIFQTVEELRAMEETKEDTGCNYNMIIKSFRWLVNMMIEIYCFKGELSYLCKLTTDINGSDNYNKDLIQRYFNEADALLEINPDQLFIISDLALGNIQSGDLLFVKDGLFGFLEVKSPSPKNLEILDALKDGKPYEPASDYDEQQYERFKKQNARMDYIYEQLSCAVGRIGNGAMLPYMLRLPRYCSSICDAVRNAKTGLCRRMEVDDCITLFTLDVEGYNLTYPERGNEFVAYCKKHYDDAEAAESFRNVLTLQSLLRNSVDGASFVDYNRDMLYPYIPKIYHTGLNGKEVSEMLLGDVNLYIQFDIEKFFDKLRGLGYGVYPKKGSREGSCVIYKGKRWIVSCKGKVLGPLGQGVLNRVFYAFYTTESVIKFFDEILMPPVRHTALNGE